MEDDTFPRCPYRRKKRSWWFLRLVDPIPVFFSRECDTNRLLLALLARPVTFWVFLIFLIARNQLCISFSLRTPEDVDIILVPYSITIKLLSAAVFGCDSFMKTARAPQATLVQRPFLHETWLFRIGMTSRVITNKRTGNSGVTLSCERIHPHSTVAHHGLSFKCD